MSRYYDVPGSVSSHNLDQRELSWSPSMYRDIQIPTSRVHRLRDLLDPERPFDVGVEPGSRWYLQRSPRFLIRTKALQPHSVLVYPKGDAIIPVNASVFKDFALSDGDILMSKDSNIGEAAMVDGEGWQDYMFSGGIVRLRPTIDSYYLFSFLKHRLFREQLDILVPKGATIRHSKTLWLDCLIPFPDQPDAQRVVQVVSNLMKAIVGKEVAIRDKSEAIRRLIHHQLVHGQSDKSFEFAYPTFDALSETGRLDAAIYDRELQSKLWLIKNYTGGSSDPVEAGFTVIPGPSLEIKLLRIRIDSDMPKPGFYALILPTHISLYGTMTRIPYLGTPRKLPLLQKGDIVFGEAGFHKGRSIVLLDDIENYTTNAHGLCARRSDGDLKKSIFFRCIFDWYRSMRLIDLMAVGGSGGHFSPEYFSYLRIPNFPDSVTDEVCRLYHNALPEDSVSPLLDEFVSWHSARNKDLGIWELDLEMKALQERLSTIQDQIVSGSAVTVPG